MAQSNPFDQFDAAPVGGGALPSPPKVEDPYKESAEARARADQTMQERKFQLDREKSDFDRQKALADQERQKSQDQRGTESERTAGFLSGRIVDAVKRLAPAAKKNPGALGPTMGVEMVRGIAGDTAANYFTDAERQTVRAAQLDILDAALTLGTGAAYNKEQLESYATSYLPQLGDDPATITSKRSALRNLLLEGAKKAGNSAPDVTAAIAALDSLPDIATQEQGQEGLAGTVTDEGPRRPGEISSPTEPEPPTDYSLAGHVKGLKIAGGDLVQGAGDLAGIFTNPINATINAATGSNLNTDFGSYLRDDLLEIPHGDPTAEAINRIGTGAFLPGAIASQVGKAPGVLGNVLSQVGANPLRDLAAGAGAGLGSEMGKSSGPVGQLAGGVIGGVIGHATSGIPGAIKGAMSKDRFPNELLAAADRQRVSMMPADAGGTGTRMASGVIGRTLGEIPMREGAEGALKTAANARNRVAANIGDVADETGAGQAAQSGAKKWVETSDKRGGQLYDAIPVKPDMDVSLENTRAGLAETIKGFTSNPVLSKIWTGHPRLAATLKALTPVDVSAAGRAELETAKANLTALKGQQESLRAAVVDPAKMVALRDQIGKAEDAVMAAAEKANRPPEGGKLAWEDMKRLRSIVGEIVGDPSLSSDGSAKAAMRRLYGALSQDMEATASQAGPKALDAFQKANRYWRGRQDRIDNVLTGVLGDGLNKGETAAFEQINRWAQTKGGDFKRLATALRSMPADEANTVRASVVSRMGQASPGRQNADGLEFSPAEFVTQWNKISPRAKSVLFPNGQHRADLNDLALVFDNMKRAGAYANTSNTGLAVNATAHAGAAISGGPVGILLSGVAAGGEFALGKLLASPRFARWLASSPMEANPAGQAKYLEKLGSIAVAEPLIANDVKAVQAYLQQSIGQSPLRAAATTEKEQDGRGVPVQ